MFSWLTMLQQQPGTGHGVDKLCMTNHDFTSHAPALVRLIADVRASQSTKNGLFLKGLNQTVRGRIILTRDRRAIKVGPVGRWCVTTVPTQRGVYHAQLTPGRGDPPRKPAVQSQKWPFGHLIFHHHLRSADMAGCVAAWVSASELTHRTHSPAPVAHCSVT